MIATPVTVATHTHSVTQPPQHSVNSPAISVVDSDSAGAVSPQSANLLLPEVNVSPDTPIHSNIIPDVQLTAKPKQHHLLPPVPVCPTDNCRTANELLTGPEHASIFQEQFPSYVKIYESVRNHGVPNYRGAKVSLPSGLNIEQWQLNQHKFPDKSLIDLLEFGFPASYESTDQPVTGLVNHSSSRAHPQHVDHYIDTELSHQAMLGPFSSPPFSQWFRTNPLLTRPKQDSDK